ncbi:MAG: DAK2 domain-containing protein, partial [Lachnospiraceae bacterium]
LVSQTEDLLSFAEQVIEHGDYVLSQTPEMLPVLKQAGVVDSGGQGLMQVVKGAFDALSGKEIDFSVEAARPAAAVSQAAAEPVDITFGYCTEFIINLEKAYDETTEHEFKSYLESIGDCVVAVSDEDIVKVHVHTNDPGLAIQKALTYGSLSRMKIDNMREEHEEKLIKDASKKADDEKKAQEEAKAAEPRKPYGFIAVSIGEGLGDIFRGIGADYLIEGGQTMNPSTEDMLNAIDQVHADTIFILPNNKNIILAAQQAQSLVEDKEIIVVPSKTVPQGITALINFTPDLSPEENTENMVQEMSRVKTGQVTYAVRNTNIDGMEITEGDIMGIGDHGMLAVGKSIDSTTIDTLDAMVDDDSELISIYYGSDVSSEDADRILQAALDRYPDCDVELHSGGQPIYYYLMSVE